MGQAGRSRDGNATRGLAGAATAAASVLLLVVFAAASRRAGLDPPALYLDDVWVASLVKGASLIHFLRLAPPLPPGFFAALQPFHALVADPELSLQIVPFACGLLLIPALAWCSFVLTRSHAAAVLAAGLAALSPGFILYSTRVKQYTMEALVVTLVLALAFRWMRAPQRREAAFVLLVAAGSAGLFFSTTSVLVSGLLVNLGALSVAFSTAPVPTKRTHVVAAVLFDVIAAALYLGLVTRQDSPGMQWYWSDSYPQAGGFGEVLTFVLHKLHDAVRGAFHPGLEPLQILVPAGILALLATRGLRFAGLIAGAFYLELGLLSAWGKYPVGGERTDIFGHPVALVVASASFLILEQLGAWARGLPRMRRLPPSLLASAAALGLVGYGLSVRGRGETPYMFDLQDAVAISFLQRHISEEDGLIVFPHAGWSLAYYGTWPFALVWDPVVGNNFVARIERPLTLNLPMGEPLKGYGEFPELLDPPLREYLGAHQLATIYYLNLYSQPETNGRVLSMVDSHGYLWDREGSLPGSVIKLVKPDG